MFTHPVLFYYPDVILVVTMEVRVVVVVLLLLSIKFLQSCESIGRKLGGAFIFGVTHLTPVENESK